MKAVAALLALLFAAPAQGAALPEFEHVSFRRIALASADEPAAAAETPDEAARHANSLRWPGGPNSTYRFVVDPANRRAADPARDIVADRWPVSQTLAIGCVWSISASGRAQAPCLFEADSRRSWSDSNAAISQLNGRPAIASPEYIMFRMGARALIAPAVYGVFNQPMPPYETGRSTESPWIRLLQFPTDSPGDDCVSLNRVGRAVSGCGDLWQDGIDPANELACYQDKTYLRCHLWCWEQAEGRPLAGGYSNGACVTPPPASRP